MVGSRSMNSGPSSRFQTPENIAYWRECVCERARVQSNMMTPVGDQPRQYRRWIGWEGLASLGHAALLSEKARRASGIPGVA